MKKYFTQNFHIKKDIIFVLSIFFTSLNLFNFSLINFHFPKTIKPIIVKIISLRDTFFFLI